MRSSFETYRGIVDFLIKRQSKSLNQALIEAQVPPEFEADLRVIFNPPVEILDPAILVTAQVGPPRCAGMPVGKAEAYYPAFEEFLINKRRWVRQIPSLRATSEFLVGRLPDPNHNSGFSERGLVIGHVQSGKTANMAALIARAADHGYKLIVVLAGLYNDLRSQTQKRLDQDITGITEQPKDAPLVEHLQSTPRWIRLTSSGLKGDFGGGFNLADLNPASPKIAVIKKNAKVLRRFNDWLSGCHVPLEQLPALVIDDEADQASINTNYGKVDDDGDPIDPSATNAAIREMLGLLPKHSYVGLTATPFANVLVDRDVADELYPEHFIATLPEPLGYLGSRQLFGLGMSPSELSPQKTETPALDIIREITSSDLAELRNLVGGDLSCPEILERAMLSFVLSCCARICRGQGDQHFTMFIHPSHTILRQQVFTDVVTRELEFLKQAIARPKQFQALHGRAMEIWESDFRRVTTGLGDPAFPVPPFGDVWAHATSVVNEIQIRTLNTDSFDTAEYSNDFPRRYLIIGGNRLSRGLTLEGLAVSVFLRDAQAYDTLLQMGRWFGYRPGYSDLTRIFVEQDISDNFADLARVELELREDLAKYATQPNPITPAEVAPRIRAHPIMLVTARNKMGAGRVESIDLAGRPRQTVTFPTADVKFLEHNLTLTKDFVTKLGTPTKSDGKFTVWADVDVSEILSYIRSYVFSEKAPVVNRQILEGYVEALNRKGQLGKWDFVLPAGSHEEDEIHWSAAVTTNKIFRSPTSNHSIGVLWDRADVDHWRAMLGRQKDDPSRAALLVYAIDKACESKSKQHFFPKGSAGVDIVGLVFLFPQPVNHVHHPYVTQKGRNG